MTLDLERLQIILYPDPRLRKPCAPVAKFDDDLARLADRMLHLMHAEEGVGLAAPQVGVGIRMFVCNLTGKPEDDRVFVNPKLSEQTAPVSRDEGCLSIPKVTVEVRRPGACTIEALDVQGRSFKTSGADLVARCWQHECDHLDGRLIVDRMSEADAIANRKALKELEAKFKRRGSR